MKVQQLVLEPGSDWKSTGASSINPQLVLAFAPLELIENPSHYDYLRNRYPNANIICTSTSGDILNHQVLTQAVVVSALEFQKTKLKYIQKNIREASSAFELGKSIFKELQGEDLCHVLIISDGMLVNGSELVGGLNQLNGNKIPITGGLAGDNARFIRTLVGLNQHPEQGNVVGIGFYGTALQVGHGTRGGWDPFGPERVVTKSDRNVLYELDGQNALELYKKYLGDLSAELPGSALLFPLNMKVSDSNESLVRTILSVDEATQSMTFAGNLPQGSRVQLMKANFDRVIDAAGLAANESLSTHLEAKPDFALLISCVGRKIVLNQRVEDEVDEAISMFGPETMVSGFYSNGEISPVVRVSRCELHNQTMTITTYKEI